MAPTRAGRPAAKESGTPTKAADGSDAPVKRGRGRPPKNGVSAQPKPVASGRPRGRPPGSGGGVKKAAAPKKPATGTGRRGRPSRVETAAATPKKAATTPKASSAKSKTKGSGTRGRPRKSDAAATAEQPDDEVEPKADTEEEDAIGDVDMATNDEDADHDDSGNDDVDPTEESSAWLGKFSHGFPEDQWRGEAMKTKRDEAHGKPATRRR